MANTVQVAFRLDDRLEARLDTFASQLGREKQGITFTRADTVRLLLTRALEEPAKRASKEGIGWAVRSTVGGAISQAGT